MPAEFQKTMDYTITILKNNYGFLDDILIVKKKSEAEYKPHVLKCLKRLVLRILGSTFQNVTSQNLKLIGSGIIFHNQVSLLSRARPALFCLSKPQRH